MKEDKTCERLRFRSWHRGTREMDLLLGSFADANLHAFTKEELEQYEAILLLSDPDLYNWMTGGEPVPTEHKSHVMQKLCAHRFAGKQAS